MTDAEFRRIQQRADIALGRFLENPCDPDVLAEHRSATEAELEAIKQRAREAALKEFAE